jgi:small subunit ribosomal protein S1
VEFDKENKKIVLSAIAALKDKSDAEIDEYVKEHKLEKVSADSVRNADSGKFDSSVFAGFDEPTEKEATKKEEKSEEKTSKEESK